MWETSARLLRLLSLLQTPRDWSGAELAERLGVDGRTVRRDIDKLRGLGYPVNATPGVPGYRLGAGVKMPPLLLDDEEAVAVTVGLRTAAGGGVAGIEEASLRALGKLEQLLPSRLRHRVAGLNAVITAMPGGSVVDPDVLAAVASATHAHEQLRFDYAGRDGASTRRRTEPHRLVHSGRHWYLLAWDLDREDWRNFRVDRLSLRVPAEGGLSSHRALFAGPKFSPRELPEDPGLHVSRGISTGVYRYQGEFLLRVPLAVAAVEISPTVGALEAVDEGSCLLRAGSNSLDELALYVALFGFPFEVIGPPELVARVGELAEMLTTAAAPRS
ncbi:YafY family protein [Phytomonospora sp. NPDC050363]|uniref:helix-turn-helix transcriptional regulator n=1 Tax=Phytomonospora sp. NPDC050363 TaxID=3155642 RepID=UPI0033EDBA8E